MCRLVAAPEFNMQQPLPAFPTNTPPGSEARIGVYADRLGRGEQLHHPRDFRLATPRGLSHTGRRLARFCGPSRVLAE
jgi:hypothetical protein